MTVEMKPFPGFCNNSCASRYASCSKIHFRTNISYCQVCGKTFKSKKHKGNDQIYCGSSCAASFNNILYKKRTKSLCKECSSAPRIGSSLFCSLNCKKASRKSKIESKPLPQHKNFSINANGLYSFQCKRCNVEFESTSHGRAYCSRECRWPPKTTLSPKYIELSNLTLREAKGEGNANFRSKLPQLRSHSRATYKLSGSSMACQICGYDKHVEICHIKDVSKYNPDTFIYVVNHINNLIALCRNHHWELDHNLL